MKSYKLDRMLYATSMAQYLGAADLTRLNLYFFVVAIVHIQQKMVDITCFFFY